MPPGALQAAASRALTLGGQETRLTKSFLVGNWKSIGWGYPVEIWKGPGGTPVGRLDFLYYDRAANRLIVVELKRGRPSDKMVGQVARYMGYVRTHLAERASTLTG